MLLLSRKTKWTYPFVFFTNSVVHDWFWRIRFLGVSSKCDVWMVLASICVIFIKLIFISSILVKVLLKVTVEFCMILKLNKFTYDVWFRFLELNRKSKGTYGECLRRSGKSYLKVKILQVLYFKYAFRWVGDIGYRP